MDLAFQISQDLDFPGQVDPVVDPRASGQVSTNRQRSAPDRADVDSAREIACDQHLAREFLLYFDPGVGLQFPQCQADAVLVPEDSAYSQAAPDREARPFVRGQIENGYRRATGRCEDSFDHLIDRPDAAEIDSGISDARLVVV